MRYKLAVGFFDQNEILILRSVGLELEEDLYKYWKTTMIFSVNEVKLVREELAKRGCRVNRLQTIYYNGEY
jgi:hypothetical protein